MTVQNIFDKVRFLTNTDSNDASDTQLFRLLNDAVADEIKFVSSLRQDFLLKTEVGVNLTANTKDYTLATDILQLKKVTISYDGTNYYVAYEKDINEATDLNNSNVEGQTSPKYSKLDQTTSTEFEIRLYPTPTANVTNGIKYSYIQRPAVLTLTSETPVVPPELHDVLVQMMVRDLKQRAGDINGMQVAEAQSKIKNEEYKRGVAQRNIDTWTGFYQPEFTE